MAAYDVFAEAQDDLMVDSCEIQVKTVVGRDPSTNREITTWAAETTITNDCRVEETLLQQNAREIVVDGQKIYVEKRAYFKTGVDITTDKRVSNINGDGLDYDVVLVQPFYLESTTENQIEAFLVRTGSSN